MQTNHFDNPDNFTNYIARLADPATSWENEGVNLSDLDRLIKNNMRLILQQTENAETAPKLQQSLYDLSKRIQEFDTHKGTSEGTSQGRSLAFEMTSVAMVFFQKGKNLNGQICQRKYCKSFFPKIFQKILHKVDLKPLVKYRENGIVMRK